MVNADALMEAQSSPAEIDFYREATLRMYSSLDMAESMLACYAYLKQHFPIEGISLHQFDPVLKGHKLYFLVTGAGFHHLERFIPFEDEHVEQMLSLRRTHKVYNFPSQSVEPVAVLHSKTIADILPFQKRAYLVSLLWSGTMPLGHLVFLGTGPSCFTPEHERKQAMLAPHFSSAMANMLQFQNTLAFQERLDARKRELEEEVRQLRGQALIGANSGLKGVMDMVSQLTDSETPVLITGETGTGKEVIADTIQRLSPRRDTTFIKVNCGAIPESLVDSELFGYIKGAFTGAIAHRAGRFEQAHGGTLFLDEVGELPLQIQVRLLRVLQNRVVERLGSNTSISVDVRLIAATNRYLENMLQSGTFREDLYYRLNVFPIRVPPLRERKDDIPSLASYFLEKLCAKINRPTVPVIRPASYERLLAYTWPGNVRELENLMERSLILCSGNEISPDIYLPQDPGWYLNTETSTGQDVFQNMIADLVARELDSRLLELKRPFKETPLDFQTLDALVKEHIQAALTACEGRVFGEKGAGKLLDVNPNTLRKKIKKLGIITKG